MKLRQIAALALLRLVADDASPQDLHAHLTLDHAGQVACTPISRQL